MQSPTDGPPTMQPQSSFDCEFCRRSYRTADKLAHHAATIHDRWGCVVRSCQSKFIRGYRNLIAHVTIKHPPLGKVFCNMCNKESETFVNWRRHAIQKHRGGMPETKNRSNRRMTRGQRDDVKAPTIKPEFKDENLMQDEVGQDVEESPTTDHNGKSGGDDAVGSFRCRACFCRLDSEGEHGALIHAENEHKAREADGKAQCQVCKEYVMYDEFAKHGFQKHIQEFDVHCPFCIDRMTYFELISHALMCPMRPQKLDRASILGALQEGRVPGSLSELEARMTCDTTRPENVVDPAARPDEPIVSSVAVKKEEPSVFLNFHT